MEKIAIVIEAAIRISLIAHSFLLHHEFPRSHGTAVIVSVTLKCQDRNLKSVACRILESLLTKTNNSL